MAKQQAAAPSTAPKTARLQGIYREKIVPDLVKKFGYKTTMQVPRITKITLNMGVSEAVADKKVMDNAVGDLTKICLLYTSPSPRDRTRSRMPSSA